MSVEHSNKEESGGSTEIPEKIAMARAVDIWLADWEGPKRAEFKDDCIEGLTGEQKFLIYSLERFLDLMEL